jgi:hypothetical protein
MASYRHKRFFRGWSFLAITVILMSMISSFTNINSNPFSSDSEPCKRQNSKIEKPEKLVAKENINSNGDFQSSTQENYLLNSSQNISKISGSTSLSSEITEPYFPLVYYGNGIDHMNIYLFDLNLSGLNVGDEIGVFDSIYCVGSAVIEDKDMQQNLLSIPASANDTIESKPNGFIPGHQITLKLYRKGIVYLLYFELLDNSLDVFEIQGSMFAFVDFKKSTGNDLTLNPEDLKVYPNPFNESLYIEFNLGKAQKVNCEIFYSTGKLIKSLINDIVDGQKIIVWDGKNNNGVKLNPGNYYLRANDQVKKIMHIY